MPDVELLDELPGKPYEGRRPPYKPRKDSEDLRVHAELLMKHPMKWARYPRQLTSWSGKRCADAIREGTITSFDPAHGFESASRDDICYVRYNPDAIDPYKVAYKEGYDAGRKEAIENFRSMIYNLRVEVADYEREARL